MNISETLREVTAFLRGHGIDRPALDAEVILAHVMRVDRYRLLLEKDMEVPETSLKKTRRLAGRRARGEPAAYLTGEKEFYSLVFSVDRSVLIPRPETELLVDLVLFYAGRGRRVLDLGTGSGAVAVAVKFNRPDLEVFASDVSEGAIRTARKNSGRILGKNSIRFYHGDLYEPFPGLRFDIIVANPPYISHEEKGSLQKEIFFEPERALFAADGGLAVIRRIMAGAGDHLSEGGRALMEIGSGMRDDIKKLSREYGYVLSILNDHAGLPRVAVLNR